MRAGSRRGLAVIVAVVAAAVFAPSAGAVTLGQLGYDGCVSDDGSGGLCADAPGTPLTGAQGVAVSPDGKSVYVVSLSADAITHFFVAPQGQLSYDGCISNDGSGGLCADAPGTSLSGADGVAVSPDGKSVYVTSAGAQAIAHFFAAPQGQISYDGCVSNDGSGGLCADAPGTPLTLADGVAVSPDGRSVYVTGGAANTITHFFAAPQGQISYDGCVSNDGSGGLCADAPGTPLFGADGVAVSPDGRSVYVTSGGSKTITHFFAAPQGQISYDGCISDDGSGGLCADAPGTPLSGAAGVAVSPDGKSVYVAGFVANTIANFSAAAQGQLTFSGCVSDDGSAGTCADAPGTPLMEADGLAMSPDGTSLYATAALSNDVVHFFRQAASGGGGGGSTRTSTITAGHLRITLTSSLSSGCVARSQTLLGTLSQTTITGSTATPVSFAKAGFFLDRGVKHVHHHTRHRHGQTIKVTTVTYGANKTATKLPATVSLRLTALTSGSHTLSVQVVFHQTKRHAGKSRTTSITRTLRQSFRIC